MNRQNTLIALFAVIALVTGIAGQTLFKPKTPEFARVFQPPRPLGDFTLTDQFEQPFTVNRLQNKWTLMFLGYTQCPDICPTTMLQLKKVYDSLIREGVNQEELQVVFVSVDPQRDQPGNLKEYINYFDSSWIAATSGHKQLFPFVRQLGLMYAMTDDQTKENYAVDHSSSVVLIDPETKLHAMFKPIEQAGKLPIIDKQQVVDDFIALYES